MLRGQGGIGTVPWAVGVRRAGTVLYPPCGPGRPPVGSLVQDLANTRLWANNGDISVIFYCKVSQKAIVSPKSHQKACHSPCSQNGLQKSPLGILSISFWPAFSHKELMGHIDRYSEIIVKMTKCRQNVHAAGRSDTPTVNRSKLPLVDRSSSDLGGWILRYSQRCHF